MLKEIDDLNIAGIETVGKLFISDRAHIVFDFHQAIDGYNEKQLGDKKIGTTNKGIGPAYGSKIMRNGLRVCDLADMNYFESRLRSLVSQLCRSYPGLAIDVEKELSYYRSISERVVGMTVDSIKMVHDAVKSGKRILAEGANATSTSTLF